MQFNGRSLLFVVLLVTLLAKGRATNLPPYFINDINSFVLSENTPIGETVITLQGVDPEGSPVHYGLDGTDLFQVDPDTGVVTVVKTLDHEENNTLEFTVTLEDEVKDAPVGKNNIVKVPVTVIVLDENDNAPVFQNVPYIVKIDEDTPIHTTVFSNIHVTDVDTVGRSIEVECVNLPNFDGACDIFSLQSGETAESSYRGSLILAKELDFKRQEEYKFALQAMDGSLNSTTVVYVKVNDVQNTPPIFTGPLSAEISEDAPINMVVLTVHAEDGDRGMPRKIVYELMKDPMNYFLLDSATGEIRTARPLDREAVGNLEGRVNLHVKAREVVNGAKGDDSLTTTDVEVSIIIKDVNDEPPAFNKKEYFAEISEDTEIGQNLPNLNMTVHDPDVGNNSVFELSLEDISHVFSIEPKIVNGSSPVTIKVTNNSLDYEDLNQRKFIVLVIAKELYTYPQLSSTATLTVIVSDANDNAPSFALPLYTATVPETAVAGTLVTTIGARDRDSGKFGEDGIIYQIVGNGAEKFVVHNRTGVITVADCATPGFGDCLDYETKQEYIFSYKATDDDGKGQTTAVPLRITLTDSNDNPPNFHQGIYHVFVDEGAIRFKSDLVLQAEDLDKTSRITYSIIGGNTNEIFSIDPNTGKIRIANNKAIQFSNDESKNNIVLIIEASDGKFTDYTKVNITISDINDHAPEFQETSYEISIPEDLPIDSFVIEMSAIDLDSGPNADIIYQIRKGAFNDFEIDNVTGVVRVASKLDFDRRNTYVIEVTANDQGPTSLSTKTILTIHIININDKSPYFLPPIQKAEIMKDARIGTIIHSLIALDPDVTGSEALNFAATEPITALDKYGKVVSDDSFKEFFSVDKHTGKVSVASALRRDIAAIIKITVLVTDTLAPTVQQGEGTLIITILDVNDHPPTFLPPWTKDNPVYYLQLQEELPVGTIVATYTANDDDSVIAGYTIVPDNEYFKINNGTGILQLKERIDYEIIQNLNFTVYAYDSGIPQLNSSATVYVTITNTNDNAPKFFVNLYNATVDENSPNGTHVITVHADDHDLGDFGTVTYDLIGEHSENFVISPKTGEIFVANSQFLDHEVLNETVIQVTASDNAPPNMKHTIAVPIHVAILDVNDNPPKFNQTEYNVTIRETISYNPPVPIVQVFASDADEGINAHLNYRITSGNKEGEFLLGTDTGILHTHKSLLGKTNNYVLEIEVKDGKYTDKAIINVFVINSNQHKPRFINPSSANSTIEITQREAIVNHLVLIVKAVDKDVGENGKLTYHLKVNGVNVQETDKFVLNETTGELRIKSFLDRDLQDQYELILVAKDHGTPVWHEEKFLLTILLVNTNKNIAEFSNSRIENPYHFYITENSKKKILVGQVKAHVSAEKHAKIYYYLISGNENDAFYLDKLDGKLYANKLFDREERSEYNLAVLANTEPDFYFKIKEMDNLDNETFSDGSIAKIKITINDVNDNPPKFVNATYYAAVNSLAQINTFVLNVSALDPDVGPNGTFAYYIKSSNLYKFGSNKTSGSIIPSPFNITQNGEIFTATQLIENNQNRFVVDVIAKETGLPEHEGSANIYVWIFEPGQLIRIILSRPVSEVTQEKDEIISELSNATNYLVIIDEIKDHVDKTGQKNPDWCDMYILVIDPSTQTIMPVYDILKIIDAKYDFLKDYYSGFAIENVAPAYASESDEAFDPALSALIALLLVLLVGIITFIVVCCCLRNWSLSSNSLKKKDALINKAVIDDLNTTENPLWIEQKLKIYEEQELSMQVFNEPDPSMMQRKSSRELITDENTYATIQHPNRRGSAHVANILSDDVEDYATLSRNPYNTNSLNNSLRGTMNYYESAMGFHGSTFQVPDATEPHNGSVSEYAPYIHSSDNSVNHEYVTELI